MKKKGWGIAAILGIAVFLFTVFAYSWVYDRLELVSEGLANPKFPYPKYSQEDLSKMFPQYVNEDVVTTQSPEETHEIFLSHLKAGNINEAVECCFVKGDWEDQKEFFQGVKDKDMWDVMVADLSEIEKDLFLGTKITYVYSGTWEGGKKIANVITFIKNSKGVWLIDSL
ncbi:MAG: hypothetical protein HOA57_01010 [Candidatus Magasanikbacteria bacterium]|jgi:hypothetical protein|nr:hypothetical protein [Candidatus Magasanikbacteria bacterium]MBT4314511.1 hypothetical protein [Candidatus Magasanikbacteria bacterium]MBT4547283.1 hypothetical protein [Candidatus Magasanikbacteria bacterium]MBT6818948.1 hypothetical protein [Candidatus Magasanikbacteria bacterium]